MDKINAAFKALADKMHLGDFFKGEIIGINNLFLLLVAVVLLIALLLVIFLVPSKSKRAQKKLAQEANAQAARVAVKKEEKKEEPAAPAEEKAPVEPAKEEIPVAAEAKEETKEPEEEITAAVVEEKKDAPVQSVTEEKAAPAEPVHPAVEEKPAEEAKAAPAAKEEAPGKNGGKYEIVRRKGSYFFLLKANNGQLLLESSAYTTEQGARKAIDTFKNAVEVGEFNIDEDKNGNYKFILRANARSQMLYHGETYGTRQSAESAIQSVKNFAIRAVVKRVEENDDDEGDAAETAVVVETKPLKESDQKAGGKYEIVERAGSYYFLLKANNGQLLLESPAFTTEQGAKNGIDTFKKAADTGIFVVDVDKNGNFRFILRASNRSQVRYFGESYSTRQSAESSVHSVRAFAQNAVLK